MRNEDSTMRNAMRHTTMLLALAGLLAGGCDRSMDVTAGEAKLPPDEDSAGFLDRMSSTPTVSENDAARGVLMLAGEAPVETFGRRVEMLLARQLANKMWDFDASRPITRGKLAYMVYQAADMPGGVMLTLTGPSCRYCLRELQYRKVMGPGTMFSPVTGLELVAVLDRADRFRRTGYMPDRNVGLAESPD
jgi:hypothetical protein